MKKYIEAPLKSETIDTLKAGDYVYISGTIYTARDAAHKRMDDALNNGEGLPFNIEENIIYYMDKLLFNILKILLILHIVINFKSITSNVYKIHISCY